MSEASAAEGGRSNLANGAANYRRAAEKREVLADWLLRFHFSTRSLLLAVLGIRSQTNNTIQRLVNAGFLEKRDWASHGSDLYVLSRTALQEVELVSPYAAFYVNAVSKINPNTINHTLSIQRLALEQRALAPSDMRPDRLLAREGEWHGKIPDLLVTYPNDVVAYEVELSVKTDTRIYRGYVNHLRSFRDGFYQRVEYVFRKPALCDYYRQRFEVEQWPLYRYDQARRRWVEKPDSLPVEAAHRARFAFRTMPAL